MKKTVSLMFTALLAAQCLMAQLAEGIKMLDYEKNKSAKEVFQKAYDANPKDPQTIYWLGQALLALHTDEKGNDQLNAAKALYQKGLQEVGSDPWLLVGMGQVEILENGDMNSVKQKFEQAITASTPTRGRNKNKPDADILNAIGRANAEVAINQGDHQYAIDKLKEAMTLDLTNPRIPINLGINYLKLGGQNGGEAVKAFMEAINRDPQNARAYYRIGKVYESQNNKELFEQYFAKAVVADQTFPPVYFAYYDYYQNKDVNLAKDYLSNYIKYADKDPKNDLWEANYLFLAGSYAESLAKVKQIDASVGAKALPKINLLYALNYDRLGDSLQSKNYLTQYFANETVDKILPSDYELAVKVFSKFPGNEAQAVSYLQKAIDSDTSKVNKLNYMSQAADLYAKAKNYTEQLKWLQKQADLRGTMGEYDYYTMTFAAFNAKDYTETINLAKKYMIAFPGKPQPYAFYTRAAKASDPDTTTGTGAVYLSYLDSVLTGLDKEKHKKDIFLNEYYILNVYVKELVRLKNDPDFKITTDGQKTPVVEQYLATCQKVVDVTDKMMSLYPDPADDNNQFAQKTKADILKRIEYYSNPPEATKKGGNSGSGQSGKNK
ncbi:MAG: tetratricopeptide repeat protein [Bacteroidota bacterium]|nr:tetratricopeptide repeat protein [Bacteroidota bacterium]